MISSIGHGGTSTVLSICGFTPLKSKNRKSKKGKLYKEIWKAKLGNMNRIPLYGSHLSAGESGSAGEVRASAAKL